MFPLLGFSEIFFQTAEKFQPKFYTPILQGGPKKLHTIELMAKDPSPTTLCICCYTTL